MCLGVYCRDTTHKRRFWADLGYVATTLFDEYTAKFVSGSSWESKNIRKRSRGRKHGSLPTKRFSAGDVLDSKSATGSTIRVLAAALDSAKTDVSAENEKHQCNFCGKSGHTGDRCCYNPCNPKSKLRKKIREMLQDKAAAAVAKNKYRSKKTGTAVSLMEKSSLFSPRDLRSYADSGATLHCFHSMSAFLRWSLTPCNTRTVMFAD